MKEKDTPVTRYRKTARKEKEKEEYDESEQK